MLQDTRSRKRDNSHRLCCLRASPGEFGPPADTFQKYLSACEAHTPQNCRGGPLRLAAPIAPGATRFHCCLATDNKTNPRDLSTGKESSVLSGCEQNSGLEDAVAVGHSLLFGSSPAAAGHNAAGYIAAGHTVGTVIVVAADTRGIAAAAVAGAESAQGGDKQLTGTDAEVAGLLVESSLEGGQTAVSVLLERSGLVSWAASWARRQTAGAVKCRRCCARSCH